MRFYHVAWHGVKVSDCKNEEEVSKGGGPLKISWEISLVCMYC